MLLWIWEHRWLTLSIAIIASSTKRMLLSSIIALYSLKRYGFPPIITHCKTAIFCENTMNWQSGGIGRKKDVEWIQAMSRHLPLGYVERIFSLKLLNIILSWNGCWVIVFFSHKIQIFTKSNKEQRKRNFLWYYCLCNKTTLKIRTIKHDR